MLCVIFDFYCNQENVLREFEYNRLPNARQNFYKTMVDIEPLEMNDDWEPFVVIVRKTKKTSK